MKTSAPAPDDDSDFDEEISGMLDKLRPVEAASKRDLQENAPPRESELSTAPLRRTAVASTHSALSIGPRWRSAARSIGVACFLLGAALLFYVFRETLKGFQNFSRPGYLSQQINILQGSGFGDAILAPVVAIGTEFMKLGYLLALGFIGSIVMAKGIQFFAASESVIDEALEDEARE